MQTAKGQNHHISHAPKNHGATLTTKQTKANETQARIVSRIAISFCSAAQTVPVKRSRYFFLALSFLTCCSIHGYVSATPFFNGNCERQPIE